MMRHRSVGFDPNDSIMSKNNRGFESMNVSIDSQLSGRRNIPPKTATNPNNRKMHQISLTTELQNSRIIRAEKSLHETIKIDKPKSKNNTLDIPTQLINLQRQERKTTSYLK